MKPVVKSIESAGAARLKAPTQTIDTAVRARAKMLAFLVLWLYFQASSAVLLIVGLVGLPNTTWLMWRYHAWSSSVLLGTTYIRPAGPAPGVLREPVMFCCNHRCWGDFFMDNVVVGGATYMARWLAAIAVPASAVLGWFFFSCEPFTRSAANKERIYAVARNLVQRGHSLIVYPEGTRNQARESNPIRWGLVRFAYKERLKVQMVFTTNKEVVWNEKAARVRRRIVCGVYHGPHLAPADFETIEAWCAAFQREWDALWKRAADPDLPMVPFEPTTTRALDDPDRLVAARRGLVAAAAVAAVWKLVLHH